tara:strand:+ start:2929 stop:3156 length:228 start_codon:yes stop_codon:yes gene_type:complete
MRLLLIFLLITGIVLFYYDRTHTPPPKKVEYRYLPRNWMQQVDDNAFVKDEIFKEIYDADTGNVWLEAYQGKKLL